MQKRRLVLQRQEDFKAGTGIAFLAEPWRNREARPTPFTAEDVFPWLAKDFKPAEEKQPIDGATLIHRLQCLGALVGKKR